MPSLLSPTVSSYGKSSVFRRRIGKTILFLVLLIMFTQTFWLPKKPSLIDAERTSVSSKNLEKLMGSAEPNELHTSTHSEMEDDISTKDSGHSHEHSDERSAVLVTTVSSKDLTTIRELVGSIHNLRHNNIDIHTIIVYGFGLTPKETREISLWRNVDYFDGYASLFLGQKVVEAARDNSPYPDPEDAKHSPHVLLNMLELNMRKFGMVLYVRNNIMFKKDSIHEISKFIDENGYFFAGTPSEISSFDSTEKDKVIPYWQSSLMGFKFGSKDAMFFIQFQLQCLRGYHCDSMFQKELMNKQAQLLKSELHPLSKFELEVFEKNPAFFCNVLLRDDILYSFEYGSSVHETVSSSSNKTDPKKSGKTIVAIGMPTLSVGINNFEQVSPIRIFFPSLLKTVADEEWKRFEYVIYIGFDDGDPCFDNVDERKKIDDHMKQLLLAHQGEVGERLKLNPQEIENLCQVRVEYIKFPYSKGWVTYIWNGLFVHSIKDGCEYFYQVNDDLRLESKKWTSYFVDKLQSMENVGVVGPSDGNRGGDGLLTQALVSWKHYEIFGKLYPLDIKDWYSDNWITDVYGERRHTLPEVTVLNVNDQGTRYSICFQPKYNEILERGKSILADWLDDQAAVKDNGKSKRRIDLETIQGPIIQ